MTVITSVRKAQVFRRKKVRNNPNIFHNVTRNAFSEEKMILKYLLALIY
jgi:hypothetical protein